jgi:hypothetical protein
VGSFEGSGAPDGLAVADGAGAVVADGIGATLGEGVADAVADGAALDVDAGRSFAGSLALALIGASMPASTATPSSTEIPCREGARRGCAAGVRLGFLDTSTADTCVVGPGQDVARPAPSRRSHGPGTIAIAAFPSCFLSFELMCGDDMTRPLA